MKFSDKVASTQEASEKENVTEILRKKTETINQPTFFKHPKRG